MPSPRDLGEQTTPVDYDNALDDLPAAATGNEADPVAEFIPSRATVPAPKVNTVDAGGEVEPSVQDAVLRALNTGLLQRWMSDDSSGNVKPSDAIYYANKTCRSVTIMTADDHRWSRDSPSPPPSVR